MKKYIILCIILILNSAPCYGQSLDDYVVIAAKNNPGLQSRYAEYEAALEKIPQAIALPDPVFSFGYFISPIETRIGPQKARFSLTQMFPWFGTLKAQGDAAALLAEAKFHAFIDSRNTLYFQVATAYYPLIELTGLKLIEQENIDILKQYQSIATKKFEQGEGSMVDVLRVDIKLKDAETSLGILNEKEKTLKTTFNKLLDRHEDEPVVIDDSVIKGPLPHDLPENSLLTDHPGLKELDLKIKAGEAGEQAAYKRGLPQFGVGLDYVMVDKRKDVTMPDNGKDALVAMVTVSIPIFRSKYRASVKEAQLMQKGYSLQKDEFANTLTSRYEMARFEIQQQRRFLALYEQQVQTSRQALNLLLSAYGNSGKEFEDVLSMQQQLLSYDKMKITAKVQSLIALAKLNALTGRI